MTHALAVLEHAVRMVTELVAEVVLAKYAKEVEPNGSESTGQGLEREDP